MRRPFRRVDALVVLVGAWFALFASCSAVATVGKWERIVIVLPDAEFTGNPFEIPVEARFIHDETGTQLALPAYYAGDSTWKLGFMPTLTGSWAYTVKSSNASLDGRTGNVDCADSDRPGLLGADSRHPRKWKFADGPYVVPIALRLEFFFEDFEADEWLDTVDFLVDDVRGHLYDTRLQDEFSSRMDVFDGNPDKLQFNLENWDRMEARMDALAARNAGAYIMFYADDDGEPRWDGRSYTEALLIRHAIARLAGYPVVIWDIGIDIDEYRDQRDIDWFGEQIRMLDAYAHPVSSRIGGGSGSLKMAGRTYDSRGDRRAIIEDMISYFERTSRPVAMADSWGENYANRPRKSFTPDDIRRAAWKSVMSGGQAIFLRGDDGYFHVDSIREDLESTHWLALVNPFIEDRLGPQFGAMVPERSLVSGGYCLADPARDRLLYYALGPHDNWDPRDAVDLTAVLDELDGKYNASWFDPRTGEDTPVGVLQAGTNHTLALPSKDDWVMLLTRTE